MSQIETWFNQQASSAAQRRRLCLQDENVFFSLMISVALQHKKKGINSSTPQTSCSTVSAVFTKISACMHAWSRRGKRKRRTRTTPNRVFVIYLYLSKTEQMATRQIQIGRFIVELILLGLICHQEGSLTVEQ